MQGPLVVQGTPVAQPMMAQAQPMMIPQAQMMAQQPANPMMPLKQGWLVKEAVSNPFFGGSKARWIILFSDRIEWREQARSAPLGSLRLALYTAVVFEDDVVEVRTDDRMLRLHPSDDTIWGDMEAWAVAIRQQAQPVAYPPQPGYAQQPMAYTQQSMAYAQPPQAYAQPPQAYAQPPQAYVQPPQAYAQQPPGVVVVQQQQPGVVVVEEERRGFGAGEMMLGVGAGVVAGAIIAEAIEHERRSSHSSHSSHRSSHSSHHSSHHSSRHSSFSD